MRLNQIQNKMRRQLIMLLVASRFNAH